MRSSLLLFVACLLTTPAGTADDKFERESLKGLSGVGVVVEALEPEAERDGLTRKAIQTDTELRLRVAGIRVLSMSEFLSAPGEPYLYINVATLKSSDGLYAYSISVKLQQDVLLERDPATRIIVAATWSTGSVGMVGKQFLRGFVRDTVKDKVDEFINAYLTVNPKSR